MKKINVLLIGLGKVGMTYDLNKSDTVFTHLKALDVLEKIFNEQMQVCVYDLDQSKMLEAKRIKSNVTLIEDFDKITNNFFDLTILAVPIESLSDQLFQILKSRISKKIVVEKPGCKNIEHLNIIKHVHKSEDFLRIGFQRRTLPMSKYIKSLFDYHKDDFSTYQFDIEFGGSFLNIASHFFDLIDFWVPGLIMEEYSGNNLGGRVVFKKKNCSVIINYKQTSSTNLENNSILCLGFINFLYSESGRNIKFFDSKSSTLNLNLSSEFDNMLVFEAIDYLNWARGLRNSSLTSFNSSMLELVLLIGGTQ